MDSRLISVLVRCYNSKMRSEIFWNDKGSSRVFWSSLHLAFHKFVIKKRTTQSSHNQKFATHELTTHRLHDYLTFAQELRSPIRHKHFLQRLPSCNTTTNGIALSRHFLLLRFWAHFDKRN